MAYNKGYNPDALPLHAEPEEVAKLMSQQQSQNPGSSRPQARYDKPMPHPPSSSNLRPQDSRDTYGRSSTPSYGNNNNNYNNHGYGDDRRRPRYDGPPPPDPRYQQHQQDPYRNSNVASPPPPANYGRGPAPTQHNRPPARPPPTPAPPRDANDRDALWKLFGAVDKDRSGQLDEKELGAALVNGDYSSFDAHTVRMMIRMFDTDRSGSVSFDEFCGLWGFLAAWRGLFDRFDVDRSGSISYNEFSDALVAFGYRLSPHFVSLLFRTYDKRGENAISFDLFVQACISLKRMTDVFKKYDEDRDGYITLSFEEFLTEIIRQR